MQRSNICRHGHVTTVFKLNHITRWQFSRVAMSLVGCYLLAAAASKLLSNGSGYTKEFPPALQFLALQFEIILGVWLILNWWKVTAWLSSFIFLLTLLSIDLYAANQGQSDCGCFGDIKLHPGITASLNLMALLTLIIFQPGTIWSEARCSVAATVTLAIVASGLALFAGTPTADRLLMSWRHGGNVILSSSVIDAGIEPVRTVKLIPLRVRNVGFREVRILGGSADCSCTTTRKLPVTIRADSEVQIELQIEFRGAPGRFSHAFELMVVDDMKQVKLHGVIVGEVAEATSP